MPGPSDKRFRDVLFVATGGSDDNDGLTWASAKRTVAGAVNALPTKESTGSFGGGEHHFGTVYVGAGQFIEEDLPIELNAAISIIGAGGSAWYAGGTEIRMGSDNHLFSYDTDVYDEFAMGVRLSNLGLNGEPVEGPYDLIRIRNGGYNTFFENLWLRHAPRHGIFIERNALSLYLYNVNLANSRSEEAAVLVNVGDSPDGLELGGGGSVSNLAWYGGQFDETRGTANIKVVNRSTSLGQSIVLMGLKSENHANNSGGDFRSFVRYESEPQLTEANRAFGHAVFFTISGMNAVTSPGQDEPVVHESGQGRPGVFCLQGINAPLGHTKAFISEITGQESLTAGVGFGVFGDTTNPRSDYRPAIETGGAAIFSGQGSPELTRAAPIGSLYLQTDGGPGATMWVKESGEGTNEGWVPK